MGWTGIIGVLLILALVFGFYLGVPTRWGKRRRGSDLNAGDRPLREREQN